MSKDLKQAAEEFLILMDRLRQLGPQTSPPRKAKISHSQLAFITYLNSNPGCGIQSIATELKLSKPTVSIGVSQLEKAGLLTRQPDPKDGRAVQLFLTSEGQKLQQQTLEFRCKKFERLLAGVTPQERATLLKLLEKAILSVESETQGEIA